MHTTRKENHYLRLELEPCNLDDALLHSFTIDPNEMRKAFQQSEKYKKTAANYLINACRSIYLAQKLQNPQFDKFWLIAMVEIFLVPVCYSIKAQQIMKLGKTNKFSISICTLKWLAK